MMKVQNLRVQVIVVQPSASTENCGSDDKDKIGTKHLNTYRTVWTLIDLLASVVGVSIFKEMGTNIRLVFTTSVICVAFPSLFYTMVVVWPNVSQLLEVICIFGVLLPVRLVHSTIVDYDTSVVNGDLVVEALRPFSNRDDESTFPAFVLYAILYTKLFKV